jgi:hypothetical protein
MIEWHRPPIPNLTVCSNSIMTHHVVVVLTMWKSSALGSGKSVSLCVTHLRVSVSPCMELNWNNLPGKCLGQPFLHLWTSRLGPCHVIGIRVHDGEQAQTNWYTWMDPCKWIGGWPYVALPTVLANMSLFVLASPSSLWLGKLSFFSR